MGVAGPEGPAPQTDGPAPTGAAHSKGLKPTALQQGLKALLYRSLLALPLSPYGAGGVSPGGLSPL